MSFFLIHSFSLTLIDALDTLLVNIKSLLKIFAGKTQRTKKKLTYITLLHVHFPKVLGNRTEFQRVATLLQESVDFDIDVNASVFETNIRGKDQRTESEVYNI